MIRRVASSRLLLLALLFALVGAGLIWSGWPAPPSAQPVAQQVWVNPSARRRSDPANAVELRTSRSPKSSAVDTSAPREEPTLGKDQREYLWQVEHHGLLLSRHGFTRLAQALGATSLRTSLRR